MGTILYTLRAIYFLFVWKNTPKKNSTKKTKNSTKKQIMGQSLTGQIQSNSLTSFNEGDNFDICKGASGILLVGVDTNAPAWTSVESFGIEAVDVGDGNVQYQFAIYNATNDVKISTGGSSPFVAGTPYTSYFTTSTPAYANAPIGQYFNVTMTNTALTTYGKTWSDAYILTPQGVSCFNKGTLIECENGVSRLVEDLRVGDLVKTYKHGIRPIREIGFDTMHNCPKYFNLSMYEAINNIDSFPNLVVTGGHSILLKEEEYQQMGKDVQEKNKELFNQEQVPMIDDCVLVLVAAVPTLFRQIEQQDKEFTYYHFTVAETDNNDKNDKNNDDYDNNKRFGVYANGWLTETPSHNQFVQHKYRGVY